MDKIKIYHWLPRILCTFAILFISMFALDAFQPERSFWINIGVFFTHLIPSFILIATLFFASKKERIGGVIFIVIGIILSPFVFKMNYNMNNSIWMSLEVVLMITVPFIVVGILFVLSFNQKNNYALKK